MGLGCLQHGNQPPCGRNLLEQTEAVSLPHWEGLAKNSPADRGRGREQAGLRGEWGLGLQVDLVTL